MTLFSNSDLDVTSGTNLELIRDERSSVFNGFPDWRESSKSLATEWSWLKIWVVFRLARVAWCDSVDEESEKVLVAMARLETDLSGVVVGLASGPLADKLDGVSLGAPIAVSDST